MNKKGIVALLLVASIPFFVHAYTSPGKPTGFVNDFAHVLSVEDKDSLESALSDYEKKTGNEISIVTVPSLGDETVETYANKLFKEWGIGKKDKDNGLLILHAPNERKIWIEVGYGLEPVITDAKASSIYRNILSPRFKAGDYIGGYTEAVSAIISTIGGDDNAIPRDKQVNSDWFFWIILIPMYLGSILARSKSWWLGGVLGALGGVMIGIIYGFLYTGLTAIAIFGIVGLIFDFIVSKAFANRYAKGHSMPWWIGGGRGGSGGLGGGFGGFGGGGSGGGGGGGGY